MFWEQKIQYAALSDVGFRRQNNQDSCVVHLAPDKENWQERGHLFVVADGMGGHAVGELASKIAVDTLPHTFDKLRQIHPTVALKTAVEAANQAIHERGLQNRDFLRMGTTCTALLLSPLGAVIAHVGDSRAYRLRGRNIDQLTRDHSLVWELIEQRKVHPRDADRLYPRNVITRSLGPEPEVEVDIEGPMAVLPGDTYILCSDGLSTLVSDAEIGMIAAELPPTDACRMLVHLANLRGGTDNITVIVVRTGEIPVGAESVELPSYSPPSGGWGPFVLFCSLALAGMVGLGLTILTRHQLVGGIILGGSALTWLIWALSRPRSSTPEPVRTESASRSTIIWRPYRTASARTSPEFVHRLAKMESELQRAAAEERWPIDWLQREEAFRRAQEALGQKKYGAALREYAAAFDVLMSGVHWQRKQQQREARWGKSTARPEGLTPPPVNTE